MSNIKPIGAQGKRYNQWRNEQKKKVKDIFSCQVNGCDVFIEDGKGQIFHLLPRTGVFAGIKTEPKNVRWTCHGHDDIEQMSLEDRVEYVGHLFGLDAHEFALDQTGGMF